MITIFKNNLKLDYKSFIFPGGEVSVKLKHDNYRFITEVTPHITLFCRIQNSNDFMELAMVKDALERIDKTPVKLFLPYLPFSRQDRVCDSGESFSLKVFCSLLNSLNFQEVVICDPHSDVSSALVNNVKIINQFDIVNKWLDLTNRIRDCVVVAPDIGAVKKTSQIAKYLEHEDFINTLKIRNLQTGEIIKMEVLCNDFKGKDVFVADDIGDGLKTFIELAKICKSKNCGKFILFITHAIFSKGAKVCFDNGIDEIFTTSSFKYETRYDEIKYYEKINIFDLEKKFLV